MKEGKEWGEGTVGNFTNQGFFLPGEGGSSSSCRKICDTGELDPSVSPF